METTNGPRNTGRREGMLCQVHLARLWGKASWGPVTVAIPLPAHPWKLWDCSHRQLQPEETTSKGRCSDREEAKDNSKPARPRSLTVTYSSARWTTVYKRTARVWTNREHMDWSTVIDQHLKPTTVQGIAFRSAGSKTTSLFFCFSGSPVTISKATKRCMSGVTIQIQDPRFSGGSVNPFFPSSEMHPLAKMSKDKCIKYMNRPRQSFQRPPDHWIWPGIHPSLMGPSPRELLDLRFNQSSSQC